MSPVPAQTPETDPPGWTDRGDLLAYARRLLGSRSDLAEDVVQEAFVRLIAKENATGPPEHPRTWLFALVRNIAADERRRSALAARAMTAEPLVPALGPPEVSERRAEVAGALRAISRLPARERRAIMLEQAGLGAPAIARRFGTTPNAIHQTLFRARRRLRDARAAGWALVPVPVFQLWSRIASMQPAGLVLGGTPTPRPPLPVLGAVMALVAGGTGTVALVTSAPHPSPRVAAAAAPSAVSAISRPALRAVAPARSARSLSRPARRASAAPASRTVRVAVPRDTPRPSAPVGRDEPEDAPLARRPAPVAAKPARRERDDSTSSGHKGRREGGSVPERDTEAQAERPDSGRRRGERSHGGEGGSKDDSPSVSGSSAGSESGSGGSESGSGGASSPDSGGHGSGSDASARSDE